MGQRSNGRGTAAPAALADLDALGDHGNAMLVAEMYTANAEQLKRLELTQAVNGADDEEVVYGPQGPLVDPSGAPLSYGRRRTQLVDAKRKLRELAGDAWPVVERIIERQKADRVRQIEG